VTATYPAFHPDIGLLANNGGDVLSSPQIVTITWPGDANAASYEKFGDLIGPSEYWKTVVSEYGVGPATSGEKNHVRITTPLASSVDDNALTALLSAHLTSTALATSKWPAPTAQSIYIMYLPDGTSLDMGGGSDACSSGVGGYHDSTQIDGKEIAYAIIPQCANDLDETTSSASHELAEAATDPHPQSSAGWTGFDDNHLSWEYFQQFQSENGDACEFYRDSFFRSTSSDLPFAVQRTWSNQSASAGHSPCVPAPAGAYFNVTPLETEDVTVDLSNFGGASKQKTKGYHVAVGETRTIALGFYSDGPTDAWTISAEDGSPFSGGSTKRTDLSLDVTSGQNGQKAFLTVKVNTAGKSKGELVTIVSSMRGQKHYMPMLIGSM
jgi:hypothetical protein